MHTSHDNNTPTGILAAAGVSTILSLIPALTMYMQFSTALLGFILAVYAFWKTFFKKPSDNDPKSNE